MRKLAKQQNRRNALKTIAGSTAAISLMGWGNANTRKSPDRIYQEALMVREETNSDAKFRSYLEEHGFKHRTTSHTISFERPPTWEERQEDQVSPEKLKDETLSGSIFLTEPCGNDEYTWADFSWTFDLEEDNVQAGDKPNDVIGIYSDDYSRIKDSQYGGAFVELPGEGSDPSTGALDTNGIAVEWDDYEAQKDAADRQDPNLGSYFGLKLQKDDLEDDPQQRLIVVEFEHTWRRLPWRFGLSSISIGIAGLSVSTRFGADSWKGYFDADETELVDGPCG